MSKVIVVVSPYGLGHLMRQIALVEALVKKDESIITVMVVSEGHEKIAKEILGDKIQYEHLPYVPFIVNNEDASVDVSSSIEAYERFWNFETQLRDDLIWGRILAEADLIVNDIECVHNPIAAKMKKKIVNISNFTWSDILLDFGKEDLARNFASWERLAMQHIQLPMKTACLGFENPKLMGYLSRELDQKNVEQYKFMGTTLGKELIFLSNIGISSENLLSEFIVKLIDNGFLPVIPQKYKEITQIDKGIMTYKVSTKNTHELIAASLIAITKAGYSSLSECVIGGTYSFHWIRKGLVEGKSLTDHMERIGYGESYNAKIDIDSFISTILRKKQELHENPLSPLKNSSVEIAAYIIAKYLD